MSTLCRNCRWTEETMAPARCLRCGSPRLVSHPELHTLAIAHIDCDAFYATIEKRDDPTLAEQPVIVGGGRRGVVSACCYIARTHGVHSAMPMFKARKLCPDAVVVRPNMEKYAAVGREVRALMTAVTPMVEPLSIDEAFVDLFGTERLHGASPATTLSILIARIEGKVGITASVGLSYNKFLAKVASDLDKPRGFAVIGRAEAVDFLAQQPVGLLWGVGKSLRAKLVRDGFATVGRLRAVPEDELVARYGAIGRRLSRCAHGQDDRRVQPNVQTKSISSETTFDVDLTDRDALSGRLWNQCERVSARLKAAGLAGATVTLKLRTHDFRILTRSRGLRSSTQLAETLYRAALPLLERECDGTAYRLIGVGASNLEPADGSDPVDLADPDSLKRAQVERAIDAVRAKLGKSAIGKGRALAPTKRPAPGRPEDR